jgi:hypothetical protein
MKASRERLLEVVYRYYPRGMDAADPRYASTPQQRRLVAARRAAAGEKQKARFHELTRRIQARLDAFTSDRSLQLHSGAGEAGYSAYALRKTAFAQQNMDERIGYCVSFLGPWYVVFFRAKRESSRTGRPLATYPPQGLVTVQPPYASVIAAEIEAVFGYELMPEEIGSIVVPDVVTNYRRFGQATLYDCLLSDRW